MPNRHNERGQTIILVAFSMLVLLALAALAIDVVTLYVSRNETQRAADAGALAGAKVFVSSGYTSGWLPASTVCNGSSGIADRQAQAAAAQNLVAGVAPAFPPSTTSCNFSTPANPRITVTVQRTGLPLFFARIWNRTSPGVSATAIAEAFNPSGGTVPIAVGSVKPWGVPNCDPNHATPANPNCGGGPGGAYFVDPSGNYAIANTVVGQVIDLCEIGLPVVPPHPWAHPGPCGSAAGTGPNFVDFLATNVPISAATVSCPSSTAMSCSGNGLTLDTTAPGFPESIACSNSTPLSCGQTIAVNANSGTSSPQLTSQQAVLCLIHASSAGQNRGQDQFCDNGANPICTAGQPINIDGGGNNPSPALQDTNNISRSDSIVTVPIFNPGANGAASSPVTIVGFLQLGIVRVRTSKPLRAVILNVVGCGSAAAPPPAISGGGLSPIPVRLVGQ